MDKKVIPILLVVVVGIVLGVGITTKQARDPLLREILKQQSTILNSQKKVEGVLSVDGGAEGSDASLLLKKQAELEQRVAAIETEFKALKDILKGAQRQMPPQEDLSKVYEIPVGQSPVRGNPKAAVTIVAFDDYQCPFCARFHPPILEVLKAYPDQVNFIIKNFPLSFHPQALPAAKAVLAAGEQGKYFEMADAILMDNRDLSDDRLMEEAKKLGLDVKKFKKDYTERNAEWEKIIQEDMKLATEVDVRGTPTFFLNGRKARARDFNGWKQEIDNLLEKKN
ncbi:MAG: thioredoxin domain-containing protein [Candidatus Omnitrophota bacterium]|nr:thioredoxin domain-containing protein [Candidatus Omnitrophota bacterium]